MDSGPSSVASGSGSANRHHPVQAAVHQIHRALCPRIATVSSPDVTEALLQPNGFTDLSHCLRPFEDCLSGSEYRAQVTSLQVWLVPLILPLLVPIQPVTVRTSQLESKTCPTFPVRFDPLAAFSSRHSRASFDPTGGQQPNGIDADAPTQGTSSYSRNERPEELLDLINAHVTSRSKDWLINKQGLEIGSDEDAWRIADQSTEELTPWFIDAREIILQSRSVSRHETFGHPAASE